MGFGGQTGLTALKFTLKSVFIDRKIIADSRNLKFRQFSQFLTDFLTFQKELKFWKIRKNWSNFIISGSAIIFLSIKTLFESIFRGFRAVWPPKPNFLYPPSFFAFFHTVHSGPHRLISGENWFWPVLGQIPRNKVNFIFLALILIDDDSEISSEYFFKAKILVSNEIKKKIWKQSCLS